MAALTFDIGDFTEIITGTEQLADRLKLAYFAGAAEGAEALQEAAQASDTYGDDTGATRKSTVAYLSTAEDDGSAAFSAALSAAEAANPGHGHSESADVQPDENTAYVFLTVPTDYAWALEEANAGDHAFIAPLMEQYAPRIREAAERRAAEALD